MIAYLRHSGPSECVYILDLSVLGLPLEARVERLAANLGSPLVVLAVEEGGFAEWFRVVQRFPHLRREDGTFAPGLDLLAYLEALPYDDQQTLTAHPEG